MHTPLKAVIQWLQVVSDLAEKEATYHQNLIQGPGSLGLEWGSQAHSEMRNEPSPCEEALAAFLDALPDAYVSALCALMYAGRDGDADPVAAWAKLRLAREDAIQAIVEKTPRMQYIAAGSKNVTDVNALPGLL
jgi:hypothetical protein